MDLRDLVTKYILPHKYANTKNDQNSSAQSLVLVNIGAANSIGDESRPLFEIQKRSGGDPTTTIFSLARQGFKNFLQNFGDLSQFCGILQNLVHIDFKILEKILSRGCAHIGTNFSKF